MLRSCGGSLNVKTALMCFVTHSPAKGLHDGEDVCHTGFDVFNRLIEQYKLKVFCAWTCSYELRQAVCQA